MEKKFQKKLIVERKLFNCQDFFGRIWAHYNHLKKIEIAIFTHNLKNRSGQWEGPGGGSSTGALCTRFTLVLYVKATVSVCLCGQCLEDSSSHCPFLVEFLIVSVFGHLEFACTWGGSPKPRHGIFKDMIFSFGTYMVWVSKTQTWKFFGHDFQDVGSLVFGNLEFTLRVSKTQKDLGNFKIWFSRLGISTLGPRFSHSRFPRSKPENF